MDKEWTPEEIQLKEVLNKLYEKDDRKPSRPLDLSFMVERPLKEREELEMVQRLLEVDEDLLQMVLAFMDAEPEIQLEIQDMLGLNE